MTAFADRAKSYDVHGRAALHSLKATVAAGDVRAHPSGGNFVRDPLASDPSP
jgi:hypothetical protein